MKLKKAFWFLSVVLLGMVSWVGGYWLYSKGRPAPVPAKEKILDGVTYMRIVKYLPHSMVAHMLVVDRKDGKFQFMVTPPDEVEGGALKARTTSQFLEEFDVQIAINGDGFFPWWSHSPADCYPHVGDPVTPRIHSFISTAGAQLLRNWLTRSRNLALSMP